MDDRQLDFLIHVKVLGLACLPAISPDEALKLLGTTSEMSPAVKIGMIENLLDPEDLPHYSTDIAAAWTVVEKMREIQPEKARWFRIDCFDGEWRAGPVMVCGDEDYIDNDVKADTAPRAICLAALKACTNP
jgi:hypothetical protein